MSYVLSLGIIKTTGKRGQVQTCDDIVGHESGLALSDQVVCSFFIISMIVPGVPIIKFYDFYVES